MEQAEVSAGVAPQHADAGGAGEGVADAPPQPPSSKAGLRKTIIICSAIFLVALGARLLSFQDNRYEARKVQTAVTEGYKHTARLIAEGGIGAFFRRDSPLDDPNHLGHPPGYSILMAAVFGTFGESDAALQIIQILADSAAAVLVFLIALSLLNMETAAIAGLLVALAPQFTYNSVMLLPDTLAVLPLLLAVYFLAQAVKRHSLLTMLLVGAMVGISCWLRANALLLAPFMAAFVPLLFERGTRSRYALALVLGALLVIAPLTISNYIIHDHFIPVSLGAGQTLLEGIADYDEGGSLGIPNTDMGLMKWEAEYYNRPDYYGTLFRPDGVRRERMRLARGFGVIRSHPFWFAGVMVRRGASMLKLERVRLISFDPPVTHSLAALDTMSPAWFIAPGELIGVVESSRSALMPDGRTLRVEWGEPGTQFVSGPVSIAGGTDYVFKLPMRIERGRVSVAVTSAGGSHVYSSAIVEVQDWKTVAEQPVQTVELPFASGGADEVKIVISNASEAGVSPILEIGRADLYALGPASFNWTRAPRFLFRIAQKLFLTAVMLPLTLAGLVRLIRSRRRRTLVILLIVPAYYMCVQSALHTEYRYVLALHYFLFVLAAVALCAAFNYLRGRVRFKSS